MCDRYDEATRKRVWFRMQTVVEYHDIAVRKALTLIDATLGDDPLTRGRPKNSGLTGLIPRKPRSSASC